MPYAEIRLLFDSVKHTYGTDQRQNLIDTHAQKLCLIPWCILSLCYIWHYDLGMLHVAWAGPGMRHIYMYSHTYIHTHRINLHTI